MSTRIGAIHVDLGLSTAQFQKGVQSAKKEAAGLGASLKADFTSIGRTFTAAFAGGIFAGGAAGLVAGIGRVNAEMAKLSDTAKMVGVGVEDLQRLRFGFEQTGVAIADVDTGLRRFARRVGEAANGGGALHDILKANNVELRNADGTMRSQVDLLRDYANLIQNAGSHQERLALAFKAFDVGGAAMVDALKDGARGLDVLMDKIEEAGGVIDEKLVQEAAQLDTEFNALWRNFETFGKRAIINVSVALRNGLLADINTIGGALRDLANDPSLHNAGRVLFGDSFMGDENVAGVRTTERRIALLQKQVDNLRDLGFDAADAERELAQARAQLEEEVAQIMAGGGGDITLPAINVTATPTIIPGGKDDDSGGGRAGARNRAAEATLREMEAVNALIDSLAHELALIGQSDLDQAKLNARRQAGASATGDQLSQIDMLVEAIHRETEAHRQAEQAAQARAQALDNVFQMAGDGLFSVLDGSVRAEDAVRKLAAQLALAAAQAALLGKGPLAGLFGGGGGGALLGSTFSLNLGGTE